MFREKLKKYAVKLQEKLFVEDSFITVSGKWSSIMYFVFLEEEEAYTNIYTLFFAFLALIYGLL